MTWQNEQIKKRIDGSYVVIINGLPCHVPNSGDFAQLHAEIDMYAIQHPERITMEQDAAVDQEKFVRDSIEGFKVLIQRRLDAFACSSEFSAFSCMASACSYTTSSIPRLKAEADYCVEMRDATWMAAKKVMEDVLAGRRAAPTWQQLEAELPVLEWPAEILEINGNGNQ